MASKYAWIKDCKTIRDTENSLMVRFKELVGHEDEHDDGLRFVPHSQLNRVKRRDTFWGDEVEVTVWWAEKEGLA